MMLFFLQNLSDKLSTNTKGEIIMLSMQHIMCLECSDEGNSNALKAAVAYPDAIRMYTGPRPYSHFEVTPEGEGSYFQFPDTMKASGETVKEQVESTGHLADHKPCAIGDDTSIEAFKEHGMSGNPVIDKGVELHLIQDVKFDGFIRDKIDCSRKYEDVFTFDGKEYSGKEIRSVIGNMEQQGIYILAKKLYDEKGITANNEWFEREVRPTLFEQYPEELAENTFKYMHIDDEYDKLISTHDFSKVNDGLIDAKEYEAFYEQVMQAMKSKDTNDAVYKPYRNNTIDNHVRNERVRAAETLLPQSQNEHDNEFSFS